MRKLVFTFFWMGLLTMTVQAQNTYSDYLRQSSRVNALSKAYPKLATVRSLVKTQGGKDIWQITIGSGNADDKPAIVIVGGVDGHLLLGTELALGFAESLLQQSETDSIRKLLEKTTFYIFPNMSPDATEQYFAALKYERQGNASTTDDDRDGKTNEDGFDDLDKNGKITSMRIASPVGDYMPHPDDARILIKAELNKGEKGLYRLLTEGIDNDKDDLFNEDGEGGVSFNRSLSYKHPSFTPGAGEFPVSQPESRSLLDYLYERFNVYATVSFGTANNLSTPFAYNPTAASQPIVSSWLQPDARIDSMVSELYNKTTGMKDAPKTAPAGGDFLSWAYYHYGRYSFSTPGWWVPKSKPDTAKGEKAFTREDAQANYLRWASQQGITNSFTPWKTITHPDFPGQVVELGGIDPFALTTPPYSLVADLVKKNNRFIMQLAAYQPEIDIINVRQEKLSGGLTRITADIINKGALGSHSKLGERSYWVKRVNVKLLTTGSQMVISGKKIQSLGSLEGFATQPVSWLIKGSGKLTLEAGSPTTGKKLIDITL